MNSNLTLEGAVKADLDSKGVLEEARAKIRAEIVKSLKSQEDLRR